MVPLSSSCLVALPSPVCAKRLYSCVLHIRSISNVQKVLNDAKKTGKVVGIHGRLGDLGTIDDKYDVAITTACGALNHIVVENTAVAQYCCDLLRKQGV